MIRNRFKDLSFLDQLREEKKSNEYFEMMLSNLSLEEVITLRLEIAYNSAGVLMYNLPIWRSLDYIIKEAVLKYCVSVTSTTVEASEFLGMDVKDFLIQCNKYNIEASFLNKEKMDAYKRRTTEENI